MLSEAKHPPTKLGSHEETENLQRLLRRVPRFAPDDMKNMQSTQTSQRYTLG